MKEEDENKLFDSRFRSILGDAREDVPGQVWLGIEQRLSMMEKAESGASGKTRPGNKTVTVPFWTRIAGSVAAAAAIAAALFLSGTFDGQVSDMQYDRIAEADGINIVGHSGMHHVKVADVPAPEMLKDISRTETAVIRDNAGNMAETYPETESEAALPVSETDEAVETDGIAQDTDGIAPTAEIQPAKDDAAEENPADEDFGNWDSLFAEEKPGNEIKTSLTLSGNAISNTNSSVSYDRAPISYTSGKNQLTQDKVSESSESSYSVPVSFGAGVKVDFSKRWAASIGVNYSLLRRTFDGAFFDVHDDQTGLDRNTCQRILQHTQKQYHRLLCIRRRHSGEMRVECLQDVGRRLRYQSSGIRQGDAVLCECRFGNGIHHCRSGRHLYRSEPSLLFS